MRRREFITLLGGTAAAWPLAVRAQQSAMPVIGFLSSASPRLYADFDPAFRAGLKEHGFEPGLNVTIEFAWAEGELARLPVLAAELVRQQVAVIATTGAPAALAAKSATATIPIAFITGDDPVRFGLVASFARPGGNATGVSFLTATLAIKRLEVLSELVPQPTTIAVLANTKSPVGMHDLEALRSVAGGLGLRLHALDASTAAEFEAAFATAADNGAGALVVAADPFFYSHRDQIVALAGRYRLPAIYHDRDFVRVGGLMGYGANVVDAYRQIGDYVGRILRGAKPIDLPVVQPTQFVLSINLKTARTLGLEVPPTLLARADEVIE